MAFVSMGYGDSQNSDSQQSTPLFQLHVAPCYRFKSFLPSRQQSTRVHWQKSLRVHGRANWKLHWMTHKQVWITNMKLKTDISDLTWEKWRGCCWNEGFEAQPNHFHSTLSFQNICRRLNAFKPSQYRAEIISAFDWPQSKGTILIKYNGCARRCMIKSGRTSFPLTGILPKLVHRLQVNDVRR